MEQEGNLVPEAPKSGIDDFIKKVIRKMSVFKRGGKILESRRPGGEGAGGPRSRNLCPEAPKPGIVDFNKKVISKRSVFERGAEF